MKSVKIDIVTAADGTATAYSPRTSGKIHSVNYLKDGTTAFVDGVDFTITAEATGESILAKSDVNASATFYPRAPTHSQAGAAALYASGGVGVLDKVGLANDRIKVVVAQGGNAKKGRLLFVID